MVLGVETSSAARMMHKRIELPYMDITTLSAKSYRAGIDDVVEVVEDGSGHLRQVHYLRCTGRKTTKRTYFSVDMEKNDEEDIFPDHIIFTLLHANDFQRKGTRMDDIRNCLRIRSSQRYGGCFSSLEGSCTPQLSFGSGSTGGHCVPHSVDPASHQLIVENRLVQMAAART